MKSVLATSLRMVCGLAALLSAAHARASEPHIGYCYPMGGCRGSSFVAMIGGQYLQDGQAVVNTAGVHVEVLDYFLELDQKTFGQLRRNKEKLEAQIAEAQTNGTDTVKMALRLAQIEKDIAAQLKNQQELTKTYSKLELNAMRKKRQFNPQIAERLKVRITIDPDAADGDRELRVRTAQGLSNPICFQVGVLPEASEKEPNDNSHAQQLQMVELPAILNGQIMPGDIDCFRFKAVKDQMLVFDVAARKLIPYLADAVPGWFQAVVALYDSNGDEVAFTDDYKFNPDPVMFYKVPESGEYTLEIKDSIYRGREDFVYRIAVGELPFITSIFPLGARQGEDANIDLAGVNLPKKHLSGRLPEASGGAAIRTVSLRNKDGYQSNPMPFAIGAFPERLEQEPNDSSNEAQNVQLPATVNGRIQAAGDRDVFCFRGNKDDTVAIEIMARRLNSPMDSVVRLTGPGLEKAVVNDDYAVKGPQFLFVGSGLNTHQADSYILQKLPETGTYFVEVGDTQAKGGADYAYRLRLCPATPDFDLWLEPSGTGIAPGGTAAFTATVLRKDGFDGLIALSARNLPDGFAMSRAEILPGTSECRFTITAPKAPAYSIVQPDIFGTAELGKETIVHQAVPVEDEMQAFLYRHLVPAQELVLESSPTPTPVAFEVVLPRSGVVDLPLGKEVRLQTKGTIAKGVPNAQILIDNAPDGIMLVKGGINKDFKNAAKFKGASSGAAFGTIIMKADEPLKPGYRTMLVLTAVVKKNKEETRYPAPAIPVRIVAASD